MNVTNLYFVLDLITEKEIKEFETERVKFSHFNIRKIVSKGEANKQFTFTTDKEFDIIISVFINDFSDIFFISIDLQAVKNNKWEPGLEQVLLHEYIKDLEPMILFLQQKKREIEQSIQKTLPETLHDEKELRLKFLMNPDTIIQVLDRVTDIYKEIIEFKNDSNFEKMLEIGRQNLKNWG